MEVLMLAQILRKQPVKLQNLKSQFILLESEKKITIHLHIPISMGRKIFSMMRMEKKSLAILMMNYCKK